MDDNPLDWLNNGLSALAAGDLLRRLVTHDGPQAAALSIAGREYINFGSNDYLGLVADPRLAAAARLALDEEGCGSGASPLVVGHARSHERLERRLAEFEETEAALVFNSGFAANVGAITALVGPGDAVFSDALNHASLIDGCRLSRAAVHVYPHGDWCAVERLLCETTGVRRRLIVTDSVFSMDGDLAPLVELAGLAQRHGCMLLVDEAHATGVLGHHGRGACELLGVERQVSVRIGTLSKALGCAGGFVCGPRSLIDWLVNRARSYVFSTALPPAIAAAAVAALNIVRDEPWRRERLLDQSRRLAEALRKQGWNVGPTESQIIPVLVGDSRRALELSAALAERGVWAPAIRPPSVPSGAARLRISLSYAHGEEALEKLLNAAGDLVG
ncbi:MAG TPA: 8-amino-7-oxononanoate synthase [Pirellulales bacterium]|nr:8-amino-7-oxononanoate synthase [Pirellulales bacterium]